jgi:hypothetical protein
MGLTQDDEMIHALAPDRSDQPFDNAILPRRGRPVPDAHGASSGKRGDTMGKRPIVRIRNPRRPLHPFGRQLELPRKQMCQRTIRVKRSTLRIVGAEIDSLVEMRNTRVAIQLLLSTGRFGRRGRDLSFGIVRLRPGLVIRRCMDQRQQGCVS